MQVDTRQEGRVTPLSSPNSYHGLVTYARRRLARADQDASHV